MPCSQIFSQIFGENFYIFTLLYVSKSQAILKKVLILPDVEHVIKSLCWLDSSEVWDYNIAACFWHLKNSIWNPTYALKYTECQAVNAGSKHFVLRFGLHRCLSCSRGSHFQTNILPQNSLNKPVFVEILPSSGRNFSGRKAINICYWPAGRSV